LKTSLAEKFQKLLWRSFAICRHNI